MMGFDDEPAKKRERERMTALDEELALTSKVLVVASTVVDFIREMEQNARPDEKKFVNGSLMAVATYAAVSLDVPLSRLGREDLAKGLAIEILAIEILAVGIKTDPKTLGKSASPKGVLKALDAIRDFADKKARKLAKGKDDNGK